MNSLYLLRIYYRLLPHLAFTLHDPLYAQLRPCHAVTSLSFGMWLGFIPAVYTPLVSFPDPLLHLSPSSRTTLSYLVSPAEKTWIQHVVGSLLFYARALDLSVLTAACQLSSHQSIPTHHDLASSHRLLNYVFSHRNPHKIIHSFSMALWACTDASFLSRPKSGSVAGCSVGLGNTPPYLLHPPPESHRQSKRTKQTLVRASRLLQPNSSCTLTPSITHNAPLHAFCQRIPVVVVWRSTLPLLVVGNKCWLSSRSP
jgi:hypothetical protein